MFHGLIQVASIKSFSCCHATTTLIQISTAKLSFLSSEVLDTTPWILLILSHGLCSAEIVVADKKQKKRQFNDTGFSIIIHDIIENLTCSSSLFFFLSEVKLHQMHAGKRKNGNFISASQIFPSDQSNCLCWNQSCQSITTHIFQATDSAFARAFLQSKKKKSKPQKIQKSKPKGRVFPVFLLTRNIQLTKLDTPDNSEWDAEGRSESEKAYFHLRKSFLFPRSSTPDWWALNYRVPQKGWEMPTST